jgi:hypothetical protein
MTGLGGGVTILGEAATIAAALPIIGDDLFAAGHYGSA